MPATMALFDDFARDARHGARILRRAPGFAAVVITTLAIAIGASVTIFSIVDAWLLRPLSFPDANRLVIGLAAQADRPSEPAVFLFYRSYLGFKERSRSFTNVSAAFRRSYLVTGRGDAAAVLGMAVSEEFFDTMRVTPMLGRSLNARDTAIAPVTVLSYGFWQQHFGGAPNIVGTTIVLNGRLHEIVGVMPDGFDVRMLEQPRGAQLWTLIDRGEPGYESTGAGPIALYGRLRDDIDLATAQAELNRLQPQLEASFPEPQRLSKFPVVLTRLQDDNTRTIRATLLTVGVAVGGLLLIACMNVGTLVVGRGLHRVQEAAIRTAIGSGYGRLVRQFLTESLVLCGVGGLAGLALSVVGVRLFTAWDPLGMLPATSIAINVRALLAASAFVGLSVLVSGLVPALRIAATDPHEALRAGGDRTSTGRGQRAQRLLLGGQFAASVMLLMVASLLVQTFLTLTHASLGFNALDLWVVNVTMPAVDSPSQANDSARRFDLYDRVASAIDAIPGVDGVAASTSPPLFSGAQVSVRPTGDQSQTPSRLSAQDVTNTYFDTVATPVIAGRRFDHRDSSDAAPVAIINEMAARTLFASAERALGRQLFLDREPPREIIGVVGNTASVFFNTLEWHTNAIVYRPAAQAFTTIMNPERRTFDLSVHVRSSRPLALTDVRRAVASVNAQVAVTAIDTATNAVVRSTQQPRFRMHLLTWFSLTSLLLTAIGVYGLVAQHVQHRSREIGIRVALGASARLVIRIVAEGAVTTAVVGVVAGCAAELALSSTLRSVIYGVDARDPSSMVLAAAVLLAVTAIAALVPARRATRIDPIRVLRSE